MGKTGFVSIAENRIKVCLTGKKYISHLSLVDMSENAFNSLTTKKQTTIFSSTNFQNMLSTNYIIVYFFKIKMANSVDLDEVAHYWPPHQDLCCLQIQLFLSLALKEFSGL